MGVEGPPLYSTLGSLKDVSRHLTLPSTMTYKERTHLAKKDPVEYKRMYHTNARELRVWERLMHDSMTRQHLPRRQYEYLEGTGAVASASMGFDQAVTLRNCTTPPPGSWIVDPPIHTLHRITLSRYRQKWPLDFYAAMRPHTQTTNQALRILGTYSSDVEFAQKTRLNGA